MPDRSTLPFWKVESIGNDFPLIHAEDLAAIEPDSEAKLAVSICDRRLGVGGDGLLVLAREGESLRLRMFNPDGTEDFCGNGLRCAARHAHSLGWVGDQFVIKHLDQAVEVTIKGESVSTKIGRADYTPERVPVLGPEIFDASVWSGMDSGMPMNFFGSVLTTGSTHTIIPTSSLPDDDSFKSVSAKIEVDPKFPKRTSVIWRVETGPDTLRIRIWERGVGETLGCGTGSSAAAADYLRRKQRGGRVKVENPGGTVTVSMDSWDAPITITGAAHEVYGGVYFLLDD